MVNKDNKDGMDVYIKSIKMEVGEKHKDWQDLSVCVYCKCK